MATRKRATARATATAPAPAPTNGFVDGLELEDPVTGNSDPKPPTMSIQNRETLDSVLADAKRQADRAMEGIQNIYWHRMFVAPLIPEGIALPTYSGAYDKNYLTLNLLFVPEREWRGPSGTAGLIYKFRKAFGIPKLARHVDTWSGNVEQYFTGNATIEGENIRFRLNIDGGADAMPPNCTIEYEEVEVPATTKRVAKVTCAPVGPDAPATAPAPADG